MQVRTANQDDIAKISALLERCYPVLMTDAYDAETLELALPVMTKANPKLVSTNRFYVVDHGTLIVGCGGWSVDTPGTGITTEKTAHIRHFAVDPNFDRRGIGKSIYARCKLEAAKAGMSVFEAFSSLNAERFYQSMGLNRIDQYDIPMGKNVNFPIVHMKGPIS